jgi:hypothetical protein
MCYFVVDSVATVIFAPLCGRKFPARPKSSGTPIPDWGERFCNPRPEVIITKFITNAQPSHSWSAVCRGAILAARAAERLAPDKDAANADYGIRKDDGEPRWIINKVRSVGLVYCRLGFGFRLTRDVQQGASYKRGHRIPLEASDFAAVTWDPKVHGDASRQSFQLVVVRAPGGPSDPGNRQSVCDIKLKVDINGIELEILSINNSDAGIAFAVWRNGMRLEPSSAMVGYRKCDAL